MRRKFIKARKHFDIILMSNFGLPGGTTSSNIEEMKVQRQAGLKTGLIHMPSSAGRSARVINNKIKRMIDGRRIKMLAYKSKVSCDVLIIRHPRVLQIKRRYKPDIVAKKIHIIVNQTPKVDYGSRGKLVYNIRECNQRAKNYFGRAGVWHPIGPQVRSTLHKHHSISLKSIQLAPKDWVNIINTREWRRKSRPSKSDVIKIGRHSRDGLVKWPINATDLLNIYPNSSKYEIHVLGGAEIPRKTLGKLPRNWHVIKFGRRSPKDFLAKLDVFVYFTHPDCVEAFGRVIFEAMAVGVPVILPYNYKVLFGEAALYAKPSEVEDQIQKLMADSEFYNRQVNKAIKYVDNNFGYSKHRSRIRKSKRSLK